MTQFKVKNRKKRRYIRKQPFTYKIKPQPVVSHSSSKVATGINWIPLFSLIFAGAMLMIVLNTRPVSITLPKLALPTVTLPDFSHILDFIPSLSLPKITLPAFIFPQITLPQISLAPMQSGLLFLVQTVFAFTISLFFLSFALFQLLNPVPMLLQLSKQLLLFENFISQTNFITLMFLSKTFLTIELGLLRYEYAFLMQEFANFVALQQMMSTSMVFCLSWIQTLWLTIVNAFMVTEDKTGEMIAQPFRRMGEYYEQIKPSLMYFTDHVQMSFDAMTKGFTDLTTITNDIAKASHK
jgi:hypothetical protein